MNMLINHFIIASRAYSQQSPTCTRVNNLVYIFSIQHSWSLSVDHVCSWKRACILKNSGEVLPKFRFRSGWNMGHGLIYTYSGGIGPPIRSLGEPLHVVKDKIWP